MNQERYDIFLSYSREDIGRVRPLLQSLEDKGFSVFWDRNILPGETWEDYLENKLASSTCVVVVWSITSVESKWVRIEAGVARENDKYVPVNIDPVKLPLSFRDVQTADLVSWIPGSGHKQYSNLLSRLAQITGKALATDSQALSPADFQDLPESSSGQLTESKRPSMETEQGSAIESEVEEISLSMPVTANKDRKTGYGKKAWFLSGLGLVIIAVIGVGGYLWDWVGDLNIFPISLKKQIPQMVKIPRGSFWMGGDYSSDIIPVHKVTIDYEFYMSAYEITFDQYDAYVKATGAHRPDDNNWGRGKRPVINVNWNEAMSYAKWLSKEIGQRSCRLPTEAEWEYAARAGTTTSYFWGGNEGINRANCKGCGSRWGKKTVPVGQFEANSWGLYDMHGNVWEIVMDSWHRNYSGAPTDGSAWLEEGNEHVIRGGSWNNAPDLIRSVSRSNGFRNDSDTNIITGFRVVCLST